MSSGGAGYRAIRNSQQQRATHTKNTVTKTLVTLARADKKHCYFVVWTDYH